MKALLQIGQFLFLAALFVAPAVGQEGKIGKAEKEPRAKLVMTNGYVYSIRVVDGDTIEATVDMATYVVIQGPFGERVRSRSEWEFSYPKQKIRLVGLNAWEMKDKPRGQSAKAALGALLGRGQVLVKAQSHKFSRDAFGRMLLRLVVRVKSEGPPYDIDVADWMIEHGHGEIWKRKR